VPYRGGAPAMADLNHGQVQVTFDVLPGAMQHIRSGSTRVARGPRAARVDSLPDIHRRGDRSGL